MIQKLEYLSNPEFSRVELQRMRAGICNFIDRHPESLRGDVSIDLQRLREAGLGQTIDVVYRGDERSLLDDFRFFRFVKAARQYGENKDAANRARLERSELFPYIEYSLNTPYSPQDEAIMAATDHQSLSEDMKEAIRVDLFLSFRHWPPTFSPEYRGYFMKHRSSLLHPGSSHPTGPPQDVIREDLNPPEKIELARSRLDTTGETYKEAKEVLDYLNEPQKQVIILLLGSADGKPRTYAETAKIMNITIEEVKKLEKESFRSLRKFPKD